MKKYLIIAILTVFITGSVFAQNITLDGYINSGLGLIITDSKSHEPQIRAFGVDSESQGYRFRLNGSTQNEERTIGARFRLQGQRNLTFPSSVNITGSGSVLDSNGDPVAGGDYVDVNGTATFTNTYGYLSMPYLYGWVNLLDNKFYAAAGLVDDSTYQTADWWYNEDQTEGLGILVRLAPVNGLSIGVAAYTISQLSGGSNNMLAGGPPNFTDRAINAKDAKYVFALAYTLPDAFHLGVSYRTKNKAAWSGYSGTDYRYNRDNFELDQIIGELRILAIKGITAVVVGVVDNLRDSKDQNLIFSETFTFKINDQFTLGLNAVQFLYNRSVSMDPSFLFNAWGSYAFGNVIPRIDLVYMTGGRSRLSTTDGRYHRKGFQERMGVADVDDDYSVFSVRPSVRFNLNSRTHIEIGNMLNFDSYNGNETASGFIGAGNNRMSNVFYLDFRWSF
ncbi:MAG: hypothetical protein LBU88_11120 [Treponema sp.]|nr:hypothetical protein [Treponema sp.]